MSLMEKNGNKDRRRPKTSNKRPCIRVQKGGICRTSAPLMCVPYVYVFMCLCAYAGVQVCRCTDVQVYVLILTYPSPGLRQGPLMIYTLHMPG